MAGKGNLTPPEVVGNRPAFPCVIEQHNPITQESNILQFGGMSQRQVIAMNVLNGLTHNFTGFTELDAIAASHVERAFAYADAFLKFEYDEAMAKLPPDAPDPNKPSLLVVPGSRDKDGGGGKAA